MKNSINKLVVHGLIAASTLGSASAQNAALTITDGPASFTIRDYNYVPNGRSVSFEADFKVGGVDHMQSLPIYLGGGSARGQRKLYRLAKTEVSDDKKSMRLYYTDSFYYAPENYNYRVTVAVTFKITDQTLLPGTVDAAKLDVTVQAFCTNGTGLPLRVYVMNDPVLGGSVDEMSAMALGNRNERQAVAIPVRNNKLTGMQWKSNDSPTNLRSWEINTLTKLGGKLNGADTVFDLANGDSPFGPAAYAGAFGFAKTIGKFDNRLETNLELSVIVANFGIRNP